MLSVVQLVMFLLSLLFVTISAVHSAITVADPSLARKFGVAESLLAGNKREWKIECPASSTDFFDRFRDLEEVNDFLKNDVTERFPNAKVKSIGKTTEGRSILSVQIPSITNDNAPVILAIAGLHGREWTSISALLYALINLSPDEIKDVTLLVVPIVNPDGYVKTFDGGTHTKERFRQSVGVETDADQPNRYWRKNGVGVDLNRNFATQWGNDTKKSMRMPGSDVYQGEKPFSERETQALRDLALAHIDNIAAFIDFHCCIGAVLGPPLPFGTSQLSKDDNELVGQKLVRALSEGGKGTTRSVKGGDGVPGKYEWRSRSSKDLGAGLSSSWGFIDLVVDLTYVVELRGKFVAPCWEIKQLGKEALFAMRALIREVATRPVLPLDERKRQRWVSNEFIPSTSIGMSNYVIIIMTIAAVGFLLRIRLGSYNKRKSSTGKD